MRDAVKAAEGLPGGRLDPPMVVILDETANVCKISDLPQLYSHLGSRGIVPLTILQSYPQGRAVWGPDGMETLFSAATVKVFGAGLDDPRFAEDISRLIGDHDIERESQSRSKTGASTSYSTARQRILGPEEVRALPKGTALLMVTGARVVHIRLLPWYRGPHAAAIKVELAATDHARAA